MSHWVGRIEDWTLLNRRNMLRLPEATKHVPASPAARRLAELASRGDVLFHGSRRGIEIFEPREQTTYDGKPTRAVFATPDATWATFFAVTDFAVAQSRWNACLLSDESNLPRTRYFFSVGCTPEAAWTDGAVYVFPLRSFAVSSCPAEWTSTEAVTPVEVVPVTPDDFPFKSRVFRHRRQDADWQRLLRLWRHGLLTRR